MIPIQNPLRRHRRNSNTFNNTEKRTYEFVGPFYFRQIEESYFWIGGAWGVALGCGATCLMTVVKALGIWLANISP